MFVPETIGAITYLFINNIAMLKKNIIGGYLITCKAIMVNLHIYKQEIQNRLIDKKLLFFKRFKRRL